MDFSIETLLFLPLLLLVPALIVTLAVVKRTQTTVGGVIAEVRPDRWTRRVLLGAPLAALLALESMWGHLQQDLVLESILLGILLVWVTPGFHDAVLGELGVQRGWFARRFADLEEWRLAGDHLRFKLDGEWTSVPCPPGDQARIRETLLAVNPSGESRFKD
ncbi:MAG: hypothetical protein ACKVXR_09395 [Planctomycetota bacterium]